MNASVTIKTNQWGVSHIYAANERDLFFAQGFQAARDRLFQFEMFRRQATGTLAEVLGEKEIDRDIGARLFQYKGGNTARDEALSPSWRHHYQIICHRHQCLYQKSPGWKRKMPLELQWLGIRRLLDSRGSDMQVIGLLSNVQNELQTARWVSGWGSKSF